MGNKLPSSWLDDPEWEILRRKAAKQPIPRDLKRRLRPPESTHEAREQPRAQAHKQTTDQEVVLNLKLAIPKIHLPDPKKLYRQHRKKLYIAGGALASFIIFFGAFKLLSSMRPNELQKPTSAEDKAAQSFNPLVPHDDLPDTAGKQAEPHYAYDETKQVLSYGTEYNKATLTLSQQALPAKLKSNRNELGSIAQSVGAVNSFDTQKGTAYTSPAEEGKAQIGVFATSDVLVFVQSNKPLDEEEWKLYINQLTPKQ